MANSGGRVLVVGSLNMDLVVNVARHPEPGDTVLGGDLQTFPGGKGANQAVAAAKASGNASEGAVMLGLVGADSYGSTLLESLAKAKVDVRAVQQISGPSGVALIAVDEGGENTIIVSPGANGKLTPEYISEDLFDGVALVLMQLEIPLETVAEVAVRARANDVAVMLNAAPVQDLPDDLTANLSYLILNEGEAAFLSDMSVSDEASAREAAKALRERGVDAVVITLGAQGVVWSSGASEGRLDAHQVEVVDTTASGDAFCGALAVRLAEGHNLEKSLHFANAAGALAATKQGAQPSLPSAREIERLLEQ